MLTADALCLPHDQDSVQCVQCVQYTCTHEVYTCCLSPHLSHQAHSDLDTVTRTQLIPTQCNGAVISVVKVNWKKVMNKSFSLKDRNETNSLHIHLCCAVCVCPNLLDIFILGLEMHFIYL